MKKEKLEPLRKKVRRVLSFLEKRYGIPRREKQTEPLDTLIETILSQNTNDRNRDRAYQRLRSKFCGWEEVLEAKGKALMDALRPGGLARQKARRIQEILRWIKRHYGRLSLSQLHEMDTKGIRETIGTLKGVGPKTLNCLLLFGLGRDAFPVDTHILRIGKRLGFIPKKMNAEKAHGWMIPLIPTGKSLSLHLNLIRFGRAICRAKRPECDLCFLAGECIARGSP